MSSEQITVKGSNAPTKREIWRTGNGIKRYIFTCAQNNTYLHRPTWDVICRAAHHFGARLVVATFTYDTSSHTSRSVKRGSQRGSKHVWYAPEIEQYIVDRSVQVAPGLVWCGEMNILPTAVAPLSGLQTYTGISSGIFPHVKVAMESVASSKQDGAKFNYTTGTITQHNYIARKAGLKAQFHHSYGGLLVEVNEVGHWWARQLHVDSDGVMYDLDKKFTTKACTSASRVAGITWGDIHVGSIPVEQLAINWSRSDSIMNTLNPKYQFMHDVLDFRVRNHHDRNNPHKRFQVWAEGNNSVEQEIYCVAQLLANTSYRKWCKTIVVDSNHDRAFERWLREADYKDDPENALFFLVAQTAKYESLLTPGRDDFHLVEWAVQPYIKKRSVKFLRQDESFVICPDASGGIECGMHSHYGPDGSRGTLRAYARMGRKSNTGHSHSAGIFEGAYRAGITGCLSQGYNLGPSSWSHSHIVTYANGKRAIITCRNGGWRA